ncbi:MAG: hypothetical protein WBK48_01950 [Dethiobacteria bacterium]|jgi:hypothetical protein|nr:hypothetical protein [Bacillota bacterium]
MKKIVVLVLSIIFMVIVLIQAWMVTAGGAMFDDTALRWSGNLGKIVALLFGIGAAFVMARPMIAMGIYGLAALLALLTGIFTDFTDLILWGILAVALGVVSFFISRSEVQVEQVQLGGYEQETGDSQSIPF